MTTPEIGTVSTPTPEVAAGPDTPSTVSGTIAFEDAAGFQLGRDDFARSDMTRFSAVYACVSILASDFAKLPIRHFRLGPDGGKTTLTNTGLARIFRRPNFYMTKTDLLLRLMESLLLYGNAYWFVVYNGRGEPDELWPLNPRRVWPYIAPDGEVWYRISDDDFVDLDDYRIEQLVPARHVLHHRIISLTHPLIGVTPLHAAASSAATGQRILIQSESFFRRASQPSGLITVPGALRQPTVERLRALWAAAYSGANVGRTAILDNGARWEPLGMTAADSQLIDQLRFTIEDVARVYRVPPFLLGDMAKASYRNAEQMMRAYYAQTLSSYINSLEDRINAFFDLARYSEGVEMDAESLLRTDFEARINGYSRAILGGIMTPNEVRLREGLNPLPGGDVLLTQVQMVPLSMVATGQTAMTAGRTPDRSSASAADAADADAAAPDDSGSGEGSDSESDSEPSPSSRRRETDAAAVAVAVGPLSPVAAPRPYRQWQHPAPRRQSRPEPEQELRHALTELLGAPTMPPAAIDSAVRQQLRHALERRLGSMEGEQS